MTTKLKIFNPTVERIIALEKELGLKGIEIHELQVYGLNLIITIKKQLPDSLISKLTQDDVLLLTKHFWFSKTQQNDKEFSKPFYGFCVTEDGRVKYTQSTQTKIPNQNLPDLVYQGYGIIDWKSQ